MKGTDILTNYYCYLELYGDQFILKINIPLLLCLHCGHWTTRPIVHNKAWDAKPLDHISK